MKRFSDIITAGLFEWFNKVEIFLKLSVVDAVDGGGDGGELRHDVADV